MQNYVIEAGSPYGLPLNEIVLPQHLKELGYQTRVVGKWHLGSFSRPFLPTNRGFESHYGYWLGFKDYYNHTNAENV